MADERLDLSALDPMREPDGWHAVVERTRARMDAVFAERRVMRDPFAAIAYWARPLLAAAAVAGLLLAPFVREPGTGTRADLQADPAERTLAIHTIEWAHSGQAPTGAVLLEALTPAGAQGGTP